MGEGVPIEVIENANPAYVRERMDGIVHLARSIDQIGMLNPILTTPDYLIMDGARRLEAAKLLRWKTVPVVATRDWETILVRMTQARVPAGPGPTPLVPEPMTYLETSDLIRRILRPLESADRAALSARSRKAGKKRDGYVTDRRRRFANALGRPLNDVTAISALLGLVSKAERKEPGAGKRYLDYIVEGEKAGLKPGTIITHLHEFGGPPRQMLAKLCPPKKEQSAVIASTISILKVLGEDLKKQFPAVNEEFTPEEVHQMERDLYWATSKLRQVGTTMRRHVTEKKEKK